MKRSRGAQLLRRLGWEVFPRKTIPRGIQIGIDLQHLLEDEERPTLLDAGANVGQTAESLRHFFPGATIHSFEPVPATFEELEGHCRSLALDVRCWNFALGATEGTARMQIAAQSEWNRIVGKDAGSEVETVEVPLRTLDAFCAEQGIEAISLLKIDCEGHDAEVLEGADSLLRAGRIQAVYVEVDTRGSGLHGDLFAIAALLKEHRLFLYGLYEYSDRDAALTDEGFCNALFVRG